MRKSNNKQALAAYFQQKNQAKTSIKPTENKKKANTITFESLHISPLFEPPNDTQISDAQASDEKSSNEKREPLNFIPLAKSPLWQKQRECYQQQGIEVWQQNKVPHQITNSPSMVNAYAKLIIRYLLDGLHNSVIDEQQPIRLLELGAGSGRFAIQMLKQLDILFEEYGLTDLDFCYVISDLSEKSCQFIAEHPYLQSYLQTGRAQVLQYDVLASEGDALSNNDLASTLNCNNPLLVIANYLFSSLPQELVYFHYGEFYQGEIAVGINVVGVTQDKDEENKSEPLYYRWKKQPDFTQWLKSQPDQLTEVLKTYLTQCLSQCYSQELLIPTGALTCLTNLKQLAPQGLMFLCADFGQQDLIKQQYFTGPERKYNDYFSLPVNFDCIYHWLGVQALAEPQQQTIQCSVQHQTEGLILNLTILHSNKKIKEDKNSSQSYNYLLTKEACEQVLLAYNPDNFFQIKQSLHGATKVLTETQQLAYLRLSYYDPSVLALFIPELLAKGVPINDSREWCMCLTKVWHNYVPIGEQDNTNSNDFLFQLGLLAIDFNHWALAQSCFITGMHWYGESIALLHNLALVAHNTAQAELAKLSIQGALQISPEEQQTVSLAQEINEYQNYCQQVIWYQQPDEFFQQLSIVPIGNQHINEFYLQYRDPQIAALSRSYQLTSVEACEAAIKYWQQKGLKGEYGYFAVIDKTIGLIGCTTLKFDLGISNVINQYQTLKTAYLSFWIGTDYQGLGFAQPAITLCIDQAKIMADRGELDVLLTSVWHHNHRSIYLLKKMGFKTLNLVKGNGVECEIFYYLPLTMRDISVEQLRRSVDKVD